MANQKSKTRIPGFVTIGCGALVLIIALGITLFCAYHVVLDPRGAISDDEALPGMLAGGVCLFFDLILIVVGIVLAVRKGPAQPVAAAPGAGGGATGAPGAPAAPAVKKPFPAQYLTGCLSLCIMIFVLGGTGIALYFFSEASSHDRSAERYREREARGERSRYLDSDYYQRRADEDRTYAYSGLGCAGFSLLLMILGIAGSVMIAKKNKKKYEAALAAQGTGGPPAGGPAPAAPSGGPPVAGSSPGFGGAPPGGGMPPGGGGTPPPGSGPPFGGPPPGGPGGSAFG